MIESYLSLLTEIYEPDLSAVDAMSLFGSVLLLGESSLEEKIDTLFTWIHIEDSEGKEECINFEEFFLAIVSLEKGIAHSLGRKASTEAFMKKIATQWFPNKAHSGRKPTDPPVLSKSAFFDLCNDRHQPIRQLLVAFSEAIIPERKEHGDYITVPEHSLSREPAAGDEWMSNPAWKKTAEKMTPPGFVGNPSKPDSTLELEWVHGYRGYDCRNNVFYVGKNHMLYHAAGLGVVMSLPGSSTDPPVQTYFAEHNDDVISIALYVPSGSATPLEDAMVATGEIGKQPAIHLWRPSDRQSLSCMRGFHTKGVSQLCFSTDGYELFSVGVDYTVALYSARLGQTFGRLLGSAQGPKDKVLHCTAFGNGRGSSPSPGIPLTYLSCGEKHIALWRLAGNTLKPEQIKLGSDKGKLFLCACSLLSGDVVVGTSEGELYKISSSGQVDRSTSQAHKHDKLVNAVCAAVGGVGKSDVEFVSGGKDGTVKCWAWPTGSGLQFLGEFLAVENGSTVPVSVRAVAWHASPSGPGTVLVGTQNCSVLEFALSGPAGSMSGTQTHPRALVTAHYKDELWGLSICPSSAVHAAPDQEGPQYCTVGDDHKLRVWSLHGHFQLRSKELGAMARACAYHPSGEVIAVGFGGRVGRGKEKGDGAFRIYRSTGAMDLVYESSEIKKAVSEVRFSPDGSVLAVGSHDDSIHIFSYANHYQKRCRFSKHNSFITHFDFSVDGKYLQSNCGAYELLFSQVSNAQQVTSSSQLKDVKWATWTCTLGWPVQGIWPSGADGSDINAVDRSPDGTLIATADDFGKVKVFRFPCVSKDSQCHTYSGHSSHVTNVRWATDSQSGETFLVSAGGEDKCVFQWRCHSSGVVDRGGGRGKRLSPAAPQQDVVLEEEEEGSSAHLTHALDNAPSGGDEFMAVKPWLGAIVAPTAWSSSPGGGGGQEAVQFIAALGEFSSKHGQLHETDSPAPSTYQTVSALAAHVWDKLSVSGYTNNSAPDVDELKLHWVHGYKGSDGRNNVGYAADPDPTRGARNPLVVYPAAALGVVLDPVNNVQRYFRGHTDDVNCLALFQPGEGPALVATGQMGIGKTYVWTVADLVPLATLTTKQKTIVMICFSSGDGRLLVTMGEDSSVTVSDWRSQRIVASVSGEPAATYHLAYSRATSATGAFLSCGDKHIRLWSLNGKNLTSAKVSTAAGTADKKKGSPQAFLTAADFAGSWVVGCEDGSLYRLQVTTARRHGSRLKQCCYLAV